MSSYSISSSLWPSLISIVSSISFSRNILYFLTLLVNKNLEHFFNKNQSAAAYGKPQTVASEETMTEVSSRSLSSAGEFSKLPYKFLLILQIFLLKHNSDETKTGRDKIRSGPSRSLSARVGSFNNADQNRKKGMVLPFEPLSVTFDEIRYAVDMPQVCVLMIVELLVLIHEISD